MSIAGLAGTLIRELSTRESIPRIPEPDLVMNDPGKVRAFVRAGREAGIVAPTYLFHCSHICEVICPGETVVDLACGPATQLAMVAQMNPHSQFIGIDLSEEMLKQAQEHIEELDLKNIELKMGDITDLRQFRDKSIDAVFSTLSLHHLPTVHDLESTFSEVARIVKPDGGIYLSDFGHLNSERSMRYFAYQHRDRQPELFTIDYLNSLKAAFHLADFQRLSAKHLVDRVRLYSTFLMPLMITIKSSQRRQVESALKREFAELRRALPIPQQRDLKDLIGLFKLGGLKSALLE